MVKKDHFEFDIELLILVEAPPVLWDKTYDVYKDRIETKKAWERVCACLQGDFEAIGMSKNAFGEYCHAFLSTANSNSYKLIFFFLFMYSTVHIFDTCREQLLHLLENNQLLYTLHCSLLTPHVLIFHYVHVQDQSLS